MAVSIRERTLAGLHAALASITGVAGLQVLRNEDTAVGSFPTLILVDADATQRVIERAGGVTLYALDVTIEGYVSATVPAATGPALSDLYAHAWAAAKSAEGSVAAIDEVDEGDMETTLISEDGAAPHAMFALSIALRFGAVANDPFTAA